MQPDERIFAFSMIAMPPLQNFNGRKLAQANDFYKILFLKSKLKIKGV